MQRVGVIFPNQASWGTHMNIAGGAVAQYAKHPANAQKFLEYLASPSAQAYFANGNNEWPVVKNVPINNPALQTMGATNFKSDPLPVSFIGMNQIKVQQMLDRVGFR
jgi:iron(III) transport system substrate-binding protein